MRVAERLDRTEWPDADGHLARYQWAASLTRPGESVNDIACGIGYGSTFFGHARYRGYDKPGAFGEFPGDFYGIDLDDPTWHPKPADVTVCFETLEHVKDPCRLAQVIVEHTARAVFVSVPTVPTMHENPFHLHDFTVADIPPLFAGLTVQGCWAQPSERSHVWEFRR